MLSDVCRTQIPSIEHKHTDTADADGTDQSYTHRSSICCGVFCCCYSFFVPLAIICLEVGIVLAVIADCYIICIYLALPQSLRQYTY